MATKTKASTQLELTVERRAANGTRPAKRLRLSGAVPGIVYGRNTEPMPIIVSQRELTRLLHSKTGEHSLVTLRMKDATGWEKPALIKEVQHDPIDGHVMHVDFHAIVLTERVRVAVPVVLKGEAVGVKQEGGILEHFLREVDIECLPMEIPAGIEFDVSALTIGQTVHVRDLIPPKSAEMMSDLDGVIASVQKPKEEKPEEVAAAEAVTEPEVLREKKEEPAESGEAAKGESAEKPEKKEAKS